MTESKFSSIEVAVNQLKDGGLIIVSDDEGRENEGDLIGLAANITPENLNFIIKQARGLVCMPLESDLAKKLGLHKMVQNNTEINETAFTISMDGAYDKTGVTTGISAYDRATTIRQAMKPDVQASDFVHPGHTFPLIAKAGGVLERTGHTEAAVDLAKLAGFTPGGVICEIVSEDGHMARQPELIKLSEKFNLPYITIKQLVTYLKKRQAA
ncbi:3,4-dihydroxy-2-butanone-4-phosphate synthase [Dellaglioa sp. BT-FLS60]